MKIKNQKSKIMPKIIPTACRLISREVIFTRARVPLALLSLRKNGELLVVYNHVVLNRDFLFNEEK